jgi:hypothetical protein
MVVSSALPATFTFLYQRLDALLSRHRADPNTGHTEEMPKIPAVLVGELELPLRSDEDRVEARLAELRAYALGLTHYHRNPGLINAEDPLLLQILSDQRHGKIAGEVVGMEATSTIRGPATSKITTESVEAGGRVIGMRAREIGDGR